MVRPRLRRASAPRPRVDALLDAGAGASLTLVAAPAGYGKSVAVATWIAGRGHAAAWVSADAGDNDPVRLWASMAAAVERVRPGPGAAAAEALRGRGSGAQPAIDALAAALERTGAPSSSCSTTCSTSTTSAACARSDARRSGAAARVARRGLAHAAPAAARPPARQGRLAEVRADDLAFTVPEARELLDAVEGIDLDDATVAAVTARTEGWPAALYLAALWARGRPDPPAALRAFCVGQGQVGEFLAGEVLGDLDPDTRSFLRRTAVLGRLCGELCDAVLDQNGSAERLDALRRSNLLVIALADQPGWYRYHELLHEYLLTELGPAEADALRRRALAWSREHEHVDDAAEYARAAGDWEALAALIETHALALLRAGRGGTIARWAGALPRLALLQHPRSVVVAAMAAHVTSGSAGDVRRLLALARTMRARDASAWTAFDLCGLRVVEATYADDDLGEAVAAAEEAVALARDETDMQCVALGRLALTRFFASDDAGAVEAATATLARPEATDRPFAYVAAAAVLSMVDARAERRHSARAFANDALAMVRGTDLQESPSAAPAWMADAVTAALEGRPARAQRAAERATRLVLTGGLTQAWALLERTAIEIRRGRLRVAGELLSHARELLEKARDPGPLAARADELAAALAAAEADAGSALTEVPSAAEIAVLRLLLRHSVREIAAELYLSVNTIKTHIRALYRKLGVNSREEAVARATALGLIDESGA